MDYRERYYNYQTQARGLLDKASLEKRFAKQSKWYGATLRAFLPNKLDMRCLDAPCGYGNFLYFLRAKGYRNIEGFDFDQKQVELARLLDLPAEKKDIFSVLAENSEPYELIASLDFIEHLTKDDALSFLDQCNKNLHPGGVLILRTPCADGPFGAHDAWNDLTHQWGMTSTVLQTILEMSGFTRVQVLDERPHPISLVGTIRWLVFPPARMIANAFCMALGLRPPKIWTRSMMAVAYK